MAKKPERPRGERYWHYLRPVKGLGVPSRVLVFQVEPQIREISKRYCEHVWGRAAGVTYWLTRGEITDREEVYLPRPADWYKWLEKRSCNDRITWIYSYGLAYGLSLLDWFRTSLARGERIVSAILSDPPSIVLTSQGRRVRKYVDAQNYWRDSLKGLLSTGPTAGNGSAGATACTPTDTSTIESKTRKVGDILCRAIKVVAHNSLCSWQPTAATLSFAAYRNSFAQSNLGIHNDSQATAMERAALRGGLNKMYRSGFVPYATTLVDANSLYPSVMKDYLHPIKFRHHNETSSLTELRQALSGYHCVATVTVSRENYERMPLFMPPCYDGSGAAQTVLPDPALRVAVATGCVENVHELARYDQGEPFLGFVDQLFALKLQLAEKGDNLGAKFVKLLLNSLPGKFAQRQRGWENVLDHPALGRWCYWWGSDPDTNVPVRYRCLGECTQRYVERGEWIHSFPGLCASVTSAARVELLRAMDLAGLGNVLYTDTDSLHLVGDGVARLEEGGYCHPSALGKWKTVVVGKDSHYWGLKHYRVGDYVCCNFLAASAKNISEGQWLQWAKSTVETRLEAGVLDCVPVKRKIVECSAPSGTEHRAVTPIGE